MERTAQSLPEISDCRFAMGKTRLCVITTHPIQYAVPWFRSLATDDSLDLRVVFFREPDSKRQGIGFGREIKWDVPLREGYAGRVLDLPTGLRAVVGVLFKLPNYIGTLKPDVALITGWNEPALVAAFPILRFFGVPIVVWGEANNMRPRSGFAKGVHNRLLRMVAAAVSIGKSNRDFYLQNGMPAEAVFDAGYFVESSRMLKMAREPGSQRQSLRDAAGFGDQDVVFCFVGKHVAFKRPELLIEAAAVARAAGYPVKLLMVGSGELTGTLRALASMLEVPAVFTGFLNQTELWRAYVPADVFVLPSTSSETWGLVVNEAMLFGLPVIVSAQVGCAPDLVQGRDTGLVFNGGAQELAAAMMAMINRRSELPEMGDRARRLVSEHYSMSRASAELKAAIAFARARA